MGLDLKTQQRENLPVYAAAEGYISRIKVEPAGFGRAIYIDHPNGFTTVYCHLNNFTPKLEAYLKEQQYMQESWRVFLAIPSGLFPVNKGDFIAYSGNTGGSQGPHTHFEIRSTAGDVNFNPMLFGFNIPDNTKPAFLRLAIYDRNKSTYEQAPRIVPVKRTAGDFVTTLPIISVSSSRVSFAITGYDTHSGSSNLNGIYEAVLYDDDSAVIGFQMDAISYESTRYLNAHIDYRTKATGGPYLQHLSQLPGYVNSIYTNFMGDGIIDLSDGGVHAIRIRIRDAYGNTSALSCRIQYNGVLSSVTTPAGKLFHPLMLDVWESENCEFYIGEKCLYDAAHIKHLVSVSASAQVVSDVHTIGETYIPLQDSITIRIRPTIPVEGERAAKVVMQRVSGAKTDVQKVEWQGEWAAAKFRDFGRFQLVVDESAPVIVPIGFRNGSVLSTSSRIAFTVKDNLVKFKNVRALLDGEWLRFNNDKGRTFIYQFDEKCPRGAHTLFISAEDEAGNTGTGTYSFTR
ncbi:MAG: M23 family metallopeptidase [Chitinophagaceae bacterium]|nr:M23 family metallopeptidase [Chitinophagaceae bacterium]